MKNKIIRSLLLTVALSTVIAVPIYAQSIRTIPLSAYDIKIVPISFTINLLKTIVNSITDKYNQNAEKPLEYELTDEGIIKPEYAEKIIKETSEKVISLIKNKDAEKLAEYVHPLKGIRFTPYTNVSIEKDVVFTKENLKNFYKDNNLYLWGYYDGRGDEIQLTPSEYYDKFIYTEDFVNVDEIGYNEVLSIGNMIENQFDVYKKAIVVEYYIPEINPEYEGIDWQSLRLVFEEYEGVWMLVGIIHNQWTI
ncbi:MAG: hypothetical protein K0R07_708 [Sedimentibacter sp.]|jgi:hypothetical protein|nr:hypothetical protein [Sedimentibacter sp.]